METQKLQPYVKWLIVVLIGINVLQFIYIMALRGDTKDETTVRTAIQVNKDKQAANVLKIDSIDKSQTQAYTARAKWAGERVKAAKIERKSVVGSDTVAMGRALSEYEKLNK